MIKLPIKIGPVLHQPPLCNGTYSVENSQLQKKKKKPKKKTKKKPKKKHENSNVGNKVKESKDDYGDVQKSREESFELAVKTRLADINRINYQ